MTQFTNNSGLPISSVIAGANQYNKDGTISSSLASALGSFNGIAAGLSGELGDAADRPLQQYQERYSGHPQHRQARQRKPPSTSAVKSRC